MGGGGGGGEERTIVEHRSGAQVKPVGYTGEVVVERGPPIMGPPILCTPVLCTHVAEFSLATSGNQCKHIAMAIHWKLISLVNTHTPTHTYTHIYTHTYIYSITQPAIINLVF